MPSEEDKVDTVAEKLASEAAALNDSMELESERGGGGGGGGGGGKSISSVKQELPTSSGASAVEVPGTSEAYENPFLKPAKRIKLRLL